MVSFGKEHSRDMRLVIAISFLILICLVLRGDGYKILVFNPRFGPSHVSFTGKMADILADTGHDVIVYQPILERIVTKNGSTNPNIRFITSQYDPSKPGMLENQNDFWKDNTMTKAIEVSLVEPFYYDNSLF